MRMILLRRSFVLSDIVSKILKKRGNGLKIGIKIILI